MMRSVRWVGIGAIAGCLFAQASFGQPQGGPADSRTELLRQLREEKAEHLTPPAEPGGFERLLDRVQSRMVGGGGGTGLYGLRPQLGGFKPGAGIAGGIAFTPFGRESPQFFQAHLLGSVDRYWGAGVSGGFRVGNAVVLTYGRYRHMPKEDVYGIGANSDIEDRSNYRLNELTVGALGGYRVMRNLSAGLRASYLLSHPGPGHDEEFPSTHEWLGPATGETFEHPALHVAFGVWLQLDTRDPPARRRDFEYLTPTEPDVIGMPLAADRGFYVLADAVRYTSINDAPFDFTRLTVQSQQHIPLRHGRNVFAFREYLSMSYSGDGTVPIYMLPALGGAYTLRGYNLFRFRDRHAFMINAEYRWQIWLFTDLAVFADAGQVYSDLTDLSLDDLHASYGAGIRIHTGRRGLARGDVAWSVEGMQIHLRLTTEF